MPSPHRGAIPYASKPRSRAPDLCGVGCPDRVSSRKIRSGERGVCTESFRQRRKCRRINRGFSHSRPLEILHRPLMLLRRSPRGKSAEVLPLPRLGILLARVEPISPCFQFPDHIWEDAFRRNLVGRQKIKGRLACFPCTPYTWLKPCAAHANRTNPNRCLPVTGSAEEGLHSV